MTTWRDIFIRFLLFAALYELLVNLYRISFLRSNILLNSLVSIILVASYLLIIKNLKDKKRVSELIKQDLAALNYTILSERPLTLREQYENFDMKVSIFFNGMSLDPLRYKNRMKRFFVVRNEKVHDFELIITIIQTWRNKFSFRIESTSRIRS